jgi:3-oxoadipate enol-lactonase
MPALLLPWGHLHYRDDGPREAPAIVFANSLGTDLRMWDGVAGRLPGYRRIRFDKRGHGLSATPHTPWTVEDLAGDAVALMDHLKIARATIAGCSIGGIIGQAMGIHHASRVSTLVLSNTAAKVGTAEGWAQRIDAVEQGGMAAIAGLVMERWFAAEFRASPEAKLWQTMLLRSDPAGYIGTCRALAVADLRDALSQIKTPVLMFAGGADQSTPPALIRETASHIAGARVVQFADSGHLPAIDAPAATALAIMAFLAGALV